MSAVNLDEIKKRYNFKQISVATWRDPSGSILPARGGPRSPSIPAAAAARPYTPTYKVSYKPPEPTDDEESEGDEEEEEEEGKADEVTTKQSEDILETEDPVDSPMEPAAIMEGDVGPEPNVVGTIDAPEIDGEEQLLPAATVEEAADSRDDTDMLVVAPKPGGQETQTEDLEEQQTSLPLPVSVPPPAPSPPPPDMPEPSPPGNDDGAHGPAEGIFAVAETEEVQQEPLSEDQAGPQEPVSSSVDQDCITPTAVDAALPDSGKDDHGDKKVTFAPGTPEPKPTPRKKKSGKSAKGKSKKKIAQPSELLPDDIVAIVDGDGILEDVLPPPELPPPAHIDTPATEALPEEEGLAVEAESPPTVEPVPAEPAVDEPHGIAPDVNMPEPSLTSDITPAEGPEDTLDATLGPPLSEDVAEKPSKKKLKSTGKEKDMGKKKSSKGKSRESSLPAGLGIDIPPLPVFDVPPLPVFDIDDILNDAPPPPPPPPGFDIFDIIPIPPAPPVEACSEHVTGPPAVSDHEEPQASPVADPEPHADEVCRTEEGADPESAPGEVENELLPGPEVVPDEGVNPSEEAEIDKNVIDAHPVAQELPDAIVSQDGTDEVNDDVQPEADLCEHASEDEPVVLEEGTESADLAHVEAESTENAAPDPEDPSENDSGDNVSNQHIPDEEVCGGDAPDESLEPEQQSSNPVQATAIESPSEDVSTGEPSSGVTADHIAAVDKDAVIDNVEATNEATTSVESEKTAAIAEENDLHSDETAQAEANPALLREEVLVEVPASESNNEPPKDEAVNVETEKAETFAQDPTPQPPLQEPTQPVQTVIEQIGSVDDALMQTHGSNLEETLEAQGTPAVSEEEVFAEMPASESKNGPPEDEADHVETERAEILAQDPTPQPPLEEPMQPVEAITEPIDSPGPAPDPIAEPTVVPEAVEETMADQPSESAQAADPVPQAPSSPTLSKSSSHKHRAERWERKPSKKHSSGDAKPAEKTSSSKRSSRHSRDEPATRERSSRTRRVSTTAEDEVERRRRREARKAQEAARIVEEERMKAEEEELRRQRHEARRALRKAEEGARIAREEAEAVERREADARRRRREEKSREAAVARPPRERRESFAFFRTNSEQARSSRSSKYDDRPASKRSSSPRDSKRHEETRPEKPLSDEALARDKPKEEVAATDMAAPSSSSGSKSHRRHHERSESDRPKSGRRDSERRNKRTVPEEKPRSFFRSLFA